MHLVSVTIITILALQLGAMQKAEAFVSPETISCARSMLKTLFNPKIPSIRQLVENPKLPVSLLECESTNAGMVNLTAEKWFGRKGAYIGVANAPMNNSLGAGSHHYYLIADGHKIQMGLNQHIVINFKKPDQPMRVFEGVVFKLNSDEALTQKILAAGKQREGKKVANCIEGVCEILSAAGVSIGKTGEQYLVTSKVMASGLLSGDVQHLGKPLSLEVLLSNSEQLNAYAFQARFTEQKRKVPLAIIVGLVGGNRVWYLVQTLRARTPKLSGLHLERPLASQP